MNRVSFIVAENSYLIRKGIVSIINRIDNAIVIKELDNLEQINSAILNLKPDFLVINPNLIPKSQYYRNFQIKMDISQKVIAISSVSPYRRGILSSFREVIELHDSKEEILNKFKKVIDPEINTNQNSIFSEELSEREKTILTHVAKGETNREIAEKLFLSTHTVITHRKNITNKLGIKTISGLTVYAILHKLVKLEEIK